jgi:hypothetical protein
VEYLPTLQQWFVCHFVWMADNSGSNPITYLIWTRSFPVGASIFCTLIWRINYIIIPFKSRINSAILLIDIYTIIFFFFQNSAVIDESKHSIGAGC